MLLIFHSLQFSGLLKIFGFKVVGLIKDNCLESVVVLRYSLRNEKAAALGKALPVRFTFNIEQSKVGSELVHHVDVVVIGLLRELYVQLLLQVFNHLPVLFVSLKKLLVLGVEVL